LTGKGKYAINQALKNTEEKYEKGMGDQLRIKQYNKIRLNLSFLGSVILFTPNRDSAYPEELTAISLPTLFGVFILRRRYES
jgi:hypothetical protein